MDEGGGEGEAKRNNFSYPKTILIIASLLLAIAAGGAGIYYLAKTRPELLGLPKGQSQTQAEADVLIAEVGKLIALPTDEKPTVATVTDIEKVKEQPFFKNAQNGDKVLIYTNAKKAILYRPSEKRIVEVGAVNINQQKTNGETQGGNLTPTPTVVVTPTVTPRPTASPTPTLKITP